MGISRRLRDFQGAVDTGGNLGLVFHRVHGPAFSTAFRVVTDDMGPNRIDTVLSRCWWIVTV